MNNDKQKEYWGKPKLIVITRSENRAESVLLFRKEAAAYYGPAATVFNGCRYEETTFCVGECSSAEKS